MFDAREANTKFSKKINDEWTTWLATMLNSIKKSRKPKHISNRVWLLQNSILVLEKQALIEKEALKMQTIINDTMKKYKRRIVKEVCEFLENKVKSEPTPTHLFTKKCIEILPKKDAEIDDDFEDGQFEISKIEMQYQNKDFIRKWKRKSFEINRKQMEQLCKEYFKQHPELEPKTEEEIREFSFLQVQIPLLEALCEYQWKKKYEYEIDRQVERTKTYILAEVMELSKFFFDLNYINEETCRLFSTSISDIENLESYVNKLCDSVDNDKKVLQARELVDKTKEKMLAAKQLAIYKPTQNIYYVDVLN